MSITGTRKPNGSGTIRSDGYVQIKLPTHPVATKLGFAFLHRVVLYDKIGPEPNHCNYCKTEVIWGVNLEVDHKDHDKSNNYPTNLVPCCPSCNKTRWNTEKIGCPHNHGAYDGVYSNGWRYCKKCKSIKEAKRRSKKKED